MEAVCILVTMIIFPYIFLSCLQQSCEVGMPWIIPVWQLRVKRLVKGMLEIAELLDHLDTVVRFWFLQGAHTRILQFVSLWSRGTNKNSDMKSFCDFYANISIFWVSISLNNTRLWRVESWVDSFDVRLCLNAAKWGTTWRHGCVHYSSPWVTEHLRSLKDQFISNQNNVAETP